MTQPALIHLAIASTFFLGPITQPLQAQEYGFFSFINASPSSLTLSIDGKEMPTPIAPGVATGGLGFEVGAKTVKVSHEEHGSVLVNLSLETEKSPILVAYLEEEKVGDTVKHKIKTLVVPNNSAETNSLEVRAIYVGKQPFLLTKVAQTEAKLEHGKAVPIAKGSLPTIRVGDEVIFQVEAEEKSNWLIALFENSEGKVVAVPALDLVYR